MKCFYFLKLVSRVWIWPYTRPRILFVSRNAHLTIPFISRYDHLISRSCLSHDTVRLTIRSSHDPVHLMICSSHDPVHLLISSSHDPFHDRRWWPIIGGYTMIPASGAILKTFGRNDIWLKADASSSHDTWFRSRWVGGDAWASSTRATPSFYSTSFSCRSSASRVTAGRDFPRWKQTWRQRCMRQPSLKSCWTVVRHVFELLAWWFVFCIFVLNTKLRFQTTSASYFWNRNVPLSRWP